MNTPNVSVLVPIYNVAPYIERCARSLFEQTLQNVEYIFVDDGTPDNSIEILQKVLDDYPHREPNVRIIHHEKNLSLGTARKTAAMAATGDYVLNVDSDDYVDHEMLEIMYKAAIDNQYDLVSCDLYKVQGNTLIRKFFVEESDSQKCAFHIFIGDGKLEGYLVNKMVKREIVQRDDFIFPEGINMAEDRIQTLQYYYYSKKILHINKPLYYYVIIESSISSNQQNNPRKANDTYKVYQMMMDFAETHFSELSQHAINHRKLLTKDEILRWLDKENRKKWYNLFPEAKVNIRQFLQPPYRFRCKLGLWGTQHHCSFLYDLYLWGNRVK